DPQWCHPCLRNDNREGFVRIAFNRIALGGRRARAAERKARRLPSFKAHGRDEKRGAQRTRSWEKPGFGERPLAAPLKCPVAGASRGKPGESHEQRDGVTDYPTGGKAQPW